MIRYLPALIELGLLIYCFLDCLQSDDLLIRNLPKWGWIVLIIVVPIVGPIAWLVAGRPQTAAPGPARTTGYPAYEQPQRRLQAPDDDPEFLAQLRRSNTEHETMLKNWEEDLRRREQALRDEPQGDASDPRDGEAPDAPPGGEGRG